MSNLYPYRYGKQFEKYLAQFGRVFSGFQVQDGVVRDGTYDPYTRRVKLVYGSMSRIVATLLNKRESFSNGTLPLMAFNLTGIERDNENKKNSRHVDHISFRNTRGDIQAYERLIGPAFVMNIELSIYASSTTELFSLVEQILLIFNPRITIQTDTSVFNSDYITEIELESIDNEINYPMGQEARVVQQSMNFRVPVRLSYPTNTDASYIEEIRARIFASSEEGLDTMIDSEFITEPTE